MSMFKDHTGKVSMTRITIFMATSTLCAIGLIAIHKSSMGGVSDALIGSLTSIAVATAGFNRGFGEKREKNG